MIGGRLARENQFEIVRSFMCDQTAWVWQHASVLPPGAIYNSTCSEMRKASSTSMPRYRTVLSSLCPEVHRLESTFLSSRQTFPASLREVLAPAVIQIAIDFFSTAGFGNSYFAPESIQNIRIFSQVENLRRILRQISLTIFSVFDKLISRLHCSSLKLSELSLRESVHLVLHGLKPHTRLRP